VGGLCLEPPPEVGVDSLKILLFAANPFGDLNLDEEIRRIEGKLDDRDLRRIQLVAVPATRPGDLIDKLNRHRPKVVQFSGHGMRGIGIPESVNSPRSPASNRDLISKAAEDEGKILIIGEDGRPKPVGKRGLVSLFRLRSDIVKIVVLNACSTGSQAEAIAEHIDCVIGTSRNIEDEAARIFASRLYRSLGTGFSVSTAFDEARIELELQGFEDQAAIPQIWARKGIDLRNMYLIHQEPDALPTDPDPVTPARLAPSNPAATRRARARSQGQSAGDSGPVPRSKPSRPAAPSVKESASKTGTTPHQPVASKESMDESEKPEPPPRESTRPGLNPSGTQARGDATADTDEPTTKDLMELVELSRELSAQVDLRPLLQCILGKATQLTDSPASSIILHDPRRKSLYLAAATGDNAARLLESWGDSAERQIPLEGSIAGKVFLTGATHVVDRVDKDSDHFDGIDRDAKSSTQSMICVPLKSVDEQVGVMQVLNKRSGNYTRRDTVLIEHFACQAAIAIRNARLFEDMIMHMGMFVSRDPNQGLLSLLKELKGPARMEKLSLMFADLRGFTQLCQLMDGPPDIQTFLSEFTEMLSDEVLSHEGIVNNFMGDGMLAIFRKGNREQLAVRCAFSILVRFDAIRLRWQESSNLSLDFLDVGIGIATDRVVLGTIGSDRGLRQFTAIGTGVNLAAHLESQARGGQRILVDRVTYGASRSLIAEFEGPEEFLLKKPGQAYGHPYQRFHLKRLRD
jgi:class 3 adenylate cyclase